jgi:hypothetical protein
MNRTRCQHCGSDQHPVKESWPHDAEWDDDPEVLCVDRVACWLRFDVAHGYPTPDYSVGPQPVRPLIEVGA